MRKILALLILVLLSLNFFPYAQAQSCLSSRLTVGGQAIVTPGSSNRIRSAASTSAEQVGQIPAGGIFTLLEGPTCVDGFLWWRVDYNGVTGWTVEANSSDYFVDPVAANATQAPSNSGNSTCSLAPQLRVNGLGRTSSNTPVRIRSGAGSSNTQVGQIDPIDTFSVLAGPNCVDGLNWWQIRVNETTGWIAEGSGSDYFVELLANTPTPTATNTPPATNTPTITPTATPVGFDFAYDLAWNSDGSRLAVASSEGVYIYDASDWSALPQLLVETPPTSIGLVFSNTEPNILLVNSDSDDYSWLAYDIATGELLASDMMIAREVNGIVSAENFVFSADGSNVAFTDTSLRVLDTENWTEIDNVELPSYEAPYLALQYTDSGFQVLEPLRNRSAAEVYIVGEDSQTISLDRSVHQDEITAAAFSPDGQNVIVGDITGSLQMWNLSSLERTSAIRDEAGNFQSSYTNDIAFHPNGLEFATAEMIPQGIVRIFDADDLAQLENYGPVGGAAYALAYSPDGTILAVIMDNYIHLLETENYTLIQILIQRP